MPVTPAVRSPLCPTPVSTRMLKAFKSQHVARSQRLAALQVFQAIPQSVWVSPVPANQGPQSKELSEKIKRAKNAGESIIQNDHISQVHPVENNLPQKQCFNKWDVPCYAPGLSLRHHQNNLVMQQCFNKPNGSCGPGYASLAPVHGRHNYQPMWPSSKQQLTSSSEFGPHEAPQPCFNYRNGASSYVYSQQLAAPNSFPYAAHTGYGNFQPQWLQLPPTLELPIGASWQPPPPGVQRQKTPREVKTSCGAR